MTFDQFAEVIRAFERHGVEYVLVGGVAVNVHGIVRTTEDIDFFVRPTAENVARIRDALRAIWDDPHIDEITAADLAGAYPTVRYGPPRGDVIIDLLAGLGTSWTFDDLDSEVRSFGGVTVRVATPATLYRMKSGTLPAARPRGRAAAARALPSARRGGLMPVQKFRTFEAAAQALVRHDDDDARVAARVEALWAFSARMVRPLGFRGVRKYRTVDEASAHRDQLVAARPR